MRNLLAKLFIAAFLALAAYAPASAQPAAPATAATAAPKVAPSTARPPYGIAVKRPLFAGACKACPWGVLAYVTAAALKPYGYEVQTCWVCWGGFGPRYMADKTIPTLPTSNNAVEYSEMPPNGVPDISATSEVS